MRIDTAPQTVDGGATVSLEATASDPDGDTLTYRWSATGGTFADAGALNTTWTAPAAQATDQPYTLTITVSDGSLSAKASVMITVGKMPPVVVSIARSSSTPASVAEGVGVWFTVAASAPPSERLSVEVWVVNTGGSVLPSGTPSTRIVEIPAASTATGFSFGLVTLDDDRDEEHGLITATIHPGHGYTVSAQQGSAEVTVRDNDVPATPTGLRVNGNHDSNGNITVRWKFDERVTSFDVRYRLTSESDWTPLPRIQTRPTTAADTREGIAALPLRNRMYRVGIKARNIDESEWSESVLVYPTDRPFRTAPGAVVTLVAIGGASLESYQPNGKFHYHVCDPRNDPQAPGDASRLPAGYTTAGINSIVKVWDAIAVWQKPNGDNIIETQATESRTCQPPLGTVTRNQVAFYKDPYVGAYCGRERVVACWITDGNLTDAMKLGTAMFNADAEWHTVIEAQCPAAFAGFRHEVGHALGLGHTTSATAFMQEFQPAEFCGPTEWDGVGLMANYQSR